MSEGPNSFHRGIAACTRYRAAVTSALVHYYIDTSAPYPLWPGGPTRARTTETLFQPLLLPPLFASRLVDYLETEKQNRELFQSWRRKGHKDEEAVLCVNCDSSGPVPRSTRRTGVFYRLMSKGRQLSVHRVAPRNRRNQFPIESKEY
jgi:hypothetical protein